MINLLYIHGYNGSKTGHSVTELINASVGLINVFSVDYDYAHPIESIKEINQFIQNNNIDICIGSSLGGFLTMYCTGIPRICVNPCFRPSMELPKIGYSGDISGYEYLETHIHDYITDDEEYYLCYGYFCDNDELLGDKYIQPFNELFKNTIRAKGNHHLSKENIYDLVDNVIPKVLTETHIFSDASYDEI